MKSYYLYGLHAVKAALHNPHRICKRILHTKPLNDLDCRDIPTKQVEKEYFNKILPPGAVHQGLVAEVKPLEEPRLEDIAGGGAAGCVVILDQITDPHNVGAILRSCAAFNVKALITQERHMPDSFGLIGKIASGALEHVPIMTVANIAAAIKDLQALNFWVFGLDEQGQDTSSAVGGTKNVAFVMGAEGKGLRPLTKKRCDGLIKINTSTSFSTLNVSNATAIILHEWYKGVNHVGR